MLKDPETFGEYRLTYRTGDIVSPRIDAAEPLSAELQDFCEAVMLGTTPRSSAALGLQVVQMIEAAERSHALGGANVAVEALDPLSLASPAHPLWTPSRANPATSPPQRRPPRHPRADGVELDLGSVSVSRSRRSLRNWARTTSGECRSPNSWTSAPRASPASSRVELLEPRDDLVDPMEQLDVVETRQMLFTQIVQDAPVLGHR